MIVFIELNVAKTLETESIMEIVKYETAQYQKHNILTWHRKVFNEYYRDSWRLHMTESGVKRYSITRSGWSLIEARIATLSFVLDDIRVWYCRPFDWLVSRIWCTTPGHGSFLAAQPWNQFWDLSLELATKLRSRCFCVDLSHRLENRSIDRRYVSR